LPPVAMAKGTAASQGSAMLAVQVLRRARMQVRRAATLHPASPALPSPLAAPASLSWLMTRVSVRRGPHAEPFVRLLQGARNGRWPSQRPSQKPVP
jgi:hypothetical protein